MKTGAHLKVREMGESVLGVTLEGNPRKPEPDHFRVAFPGGDVDIARCTDGTYWIHIRVVRDSDPMYYPGVQKAVFLDSRFDCRGLHAGETDMGDFGRSDLYHVAFKVAREL